MAFATQVVAKTDVGCVRLINEDSFGYDTDKGIFVVCDGIGGQAAGEVASKIAVDTLLKCFSGRPRKDLGLRITKASENVSEHARALADAIQLANAAVRGAVSHDPTLTGMGSTIACVLVDDNLFSIGHLGDSRVYRVHEGAIQQLTQDHSLVVQQVQMGLMNSEDAKKSGLQNVILRALGSEEIVEPDLDDGIAESGDILLLASDGLTRALSDQEILRVVLTEADLEHACNSLVQRAKDLGGDDNITCLLIRFIEQTWYQSWLSKFHF